MYWALVVYTPRFKKSGKKKNRRKVDVMATAVKRSDLLPAYFDTMQALTGEDVEIGFDEFWYEEEEATEHV